MSVQQTNYAAQASITFTSVNSLANGSAAQCAVVDNTTNLYLDALVSVNLTWSGTTISSDQVCYVYAYGWDAGGTPKYTGTASGSDASYAMTTPSPLKLIGVVPGTASTLVQAGPFSVASGFGGILPGKWGLVITNVSGSALSASGNTITYVGITGVIN